MCVFLISPVPIAEPLTSELIDTPVFYNLAPRPIKYRVSVPIPNNKFVNFVACITHSWEPFILLTESKIKKTGRENGCVIFSPIRSLPRPLFSTFFITVVRNDRCWNGLWHFKQISSSKSLKVSVDPLLHLKNRFLPLVQFSHNSVPTYPSMLLRGHLMTEICFLSGYSA